MKYKLINDKTQKTYALIFETGDDVTEEIIAFAKAQQLSASQFTAIGAFSEATLGFFDFGLKDYKEILVNEQTEVLSMNGDITLNEKGDVQLHAHVVLGKSDGTAHGGHLMSATVHPTLEVILTESPAHLIRKHDDETGLSLIRI